MAEPTDAQREEFWKGLGFKIQTVWPDYVDLEKVLKWTYPDGSYHKECPPTDLNSLFEWAVSKYIRYYEDKGYNTASAWQMLFAEWLNMMAEQVGNDPALALFWALGQIISDKEE